MKTFPLAVVLLFSPLALAAADRWQSHDDHVLLDSTTGLQWTRQDNGANIDWEGAKRYCNALKQSGGGWRLPTVEELTAIYLLGQEQTTTCGSYADKAFTCNVSAQFQLSGPWFWSSTSAAPANDGLPRAIDVNLINGLQHPFGVQNADYGRALCVRQS